MRSLLYVLTLVVFSSVLMASNCDNFELEETLRKLTGCETGESQACKCVDNENGFQICEEGGESWGECVCEGTRIPNCAPQTEVCDGLDNDCDGKIDDNAIDAVKWYRDKDDDGFGKEIAIVACEASGLFRAQKSGDCDDENEFVNPNTVEQCDSIDNNCNGKIDEGLIVTLYLDEDADGFGTEVIYRGCPGPAGAQKGGDCDDDDDAINPGIDEVECDGKDNNCDGKIDPDTWLDPVTGICWQDGAIDTTTTYVSAENYCANLVLAGFSDWTVPSIDALRSLIRGCPANEPGGFCPVTSESDASVDVTLCDGCDVAMGPGPGGCYWPEDLSGVCGYEYHSSSRSAGDGDNRYWRVYFAGGSIGQPKLGDERALVRCARNDFE